MGRVQQGLDKKSPSTDYEPHECDISNHFCKWKSFHTFQSHHNNHTWILPLGLEKRVVPPYSLQELVSRWDQKLEEVNAPFQEFSAQEQYACQQCELSKCQESEDSPISSLRSSYQWIRSILMQSAMQVPATVSFKIFELVLSARFPKKTVQCSARQSNLKISIHSIAPRLYLPAV